MAPEPRRRELWILLGFVLLSALYTDPLFFLRERQIYGLQDDFVRTINTFWGIWKNGDWWGLSRVRMDLNAPEGLPSHPTPQYLYWWSVAVLYPFFGPFQITNVVIAVSFPLSAYFMYRLAFDLTGCRNAALLAGFLYAFCPWHQSRAEAFAEMASIQWLPLYAWAILRYMRRPGLGRALGVSGSFVLLFNFSHVIGFMVLLFSVPLLGVWHAGKIRELGRLGTNSVGILVVLAGGFVLALSGAAWDLLRPDPLWQESGAAMARVADPRELRLGSVSPLHFLLPTYWHPLWGDGIREWMLRMKPDGWLLDDVVNPGFVVWTLGVAASARLWQERRSREAGPWRLFIFLSLAAGILCLDPVVGGRVLPLPNVLIYHLAPVFRAYSRFALLLTFFAILLGAWEWSRRIAPLDSRKRNLMTLVLLLVAGFELYRPMGREVLDLRKTPEIYRWLRDLPGDPIVAEYPLVTRKIPYEPSYLFWQVYHGKRLLNGERPGSKGFEFRNKVADFRSPEALKALRERGVRYLAIHKYHYIAERFPGLDPRAGNVRYPIPQRLKGARLVAEWDDAGVYEIEGVR